MEHVGQRQEAETDREIGKPIDCHRNTGSERPRIRWEELANQEPGDAARATGKHDDERVSGEHGQKAGRGARVLVADEGAGVRAQAEGQYTAADCHSKQTCHVKCLPAGAINKDQREAGHKNVHYRHPQGGVQCALLAQAGVSENRCGIEEDCVDS